MLALEQFCVRNTARPGSQRPGSQDSAPRQCPLPSTEELHTPPKCTRQGGVYNRDGVRCPPRFPYVQSGVSPESRARDPKRITRKDSRVLGSPWIPRAPKEHGMCPRLPREYRGTSAQAHAPLGHVPTWTTRLPGVSTPECRLMQQLFLSSGPAVRPGTHFLSVLTPSRALW